MWVELAVGVVSSAIGVIVSLAFGVYQISEARIAARQSENFLVDWRGALNGRIHSMDEKLDRILEPDGGQ